METLRIITTLVQLITVIIQYKLLKDLLTINKIILRGAKLK